jgi:hypothetical protein
MPKWMNTWRRRPHRQPPAPLENPQEAADGKAKAYQVRQLLAAIDRLEVMRAEKGED